MHRTLWMCVAVAVLASLTMAEPERLKIGTLATADPLPKGYEVGMQFWDQNDKIRWTTFLVKKEGSSTTAILRVDKKPVAKPEARLNLLQGYLDAAESKYMQDDWRSKARDFPAPDKIDFSKPIGIDMDLTKDGEKPRIMHVEIVFDTLPFHIATVGSNKDEVSELVKWSQSVRLAANPATHPVTGK